MTETWTDKALARAQHAEREAERVNAIVHDGGNRHSELYRLARLGLHAEMVREKWYTTDSLSDLAAMRLLSKHLAWTR